MTEGDNCREKQKLEEAERKKWARPVRVVGVMGRSGRHSVKRPRVEEAEKARFLGITVPGVLMPHPS